MQNFPPLLCWRKALSLNPAILLATTRKSLGNERKVCQTGNEEETTNTQPVIFVFTICRNHMTSTITLNLDHYGKKEGPHYTKWNLGLSLASLLLTKLILY